MKTKLLGDFTRFSRLAAAIFRQEGVLSKDGSWNTKALGYRYNNPGNLIFAKQPGARPVTAFDPGMGKDQKYAHFDTLALGIAATERQLALDASRGETLRERMDTWATGNKAEYIANVCQWLAVHPDISLEECGDLPRFTFPS